MDTALGLDTARGLDTALGLSVTPTTVGWVLAEGLGADGTILDHRELALRAGNGVPAVDTAEQVAAEVLRVDAQVTASGHYLRGIGVTWSDDAAAQARCASLPMMSSQYRRGGSGIPCTMRKKTRVKRAHD